jgi:hypothetical protein
LQFDWLPRRTELPGDIDHAARNRALPPIGRFYSRQIRFDELLGADNHGHKKKQQSRITGEESNVA